MCGIAGIVGKDPSAEVALAEVRRMCDQIEIGRAHV